MRRISPFRLLAQLAAYPRSYSAKRELPEGSPGTWPGTQSTSIRPNWALTYLLAVRLGRGGWSLRTRIGFAAAVAIVGSIVISSTAPAVLEGASDRDRDLVSKVNSGVDGSGALTLGDLSVGVLTSAGDASSLPTKVSSLGIRSCNQSSEIDTTVPATGGSASASPAREGFCFGQHDVIEYYEIRRNTDRRSVDLNDNGVPSAVRSHIVDSQLILDRPAVVAKSDDASAGAAQRTNPAARAGGSVAPASHTRRAWIFHPVGCSRCAGQVARSSPRRAKPFAVALLADFFRNARSVRRERLLSGVARQRAPARVAAWNFPRVWWNASLRHLKEDNS